MSTWQERGKSPPSSPTSSSSLKPSVYDDSTLHGSLPVKTKLTMGIGESVQACYTVICGFFLNAYLLEVACLSPNYVGTIQLIQGLFDAFNDPFIGTMSDRTRTRWGRRRPWLLFAAAPLGGCYFGIWNTLEDGVSEGVKFGFYLCMYMGISIGITCIQVQIGALVPELTLDYDERTSLSVYRLGIGNLIALVAVMIHSAIVTSFHDEGEIDKGYQLSGAIFGSWICIAAWTTFWNIEEKFDPDLEEKDEQLSTLDGLKIVFQNKAFLIVVGIYLCGPTAVVLVQTNILLYCKYILGNEDLVDYIIGIVQGMALIVLPLWNFVGQKYGKKMSYYIGGSILCVSLASLYFVEEENTALIVSCFIGSCLGIPYMIPYSMLPDVIEEDELKTGKRREGVYFGFFTIFLKLSVTIALSFTNFALSAAGYEKPTSTCGVGLTEEEMEAAAALPDTQPDGVISVMRFMVGPCPALFFILAIFMVWLFPITRESHQENAEVIKRERNRRSIQLESKKAAELGKMVLAKSNGVDDDVMVDIDNNQL
ncbi:hypothetical protein TrVE_jg1367 [Triparma verrucosa]|uniref:Sugar transporter n=1 Tax=Triparma verrucosa TaxID=1606542 RepID=A0A9W6Z728_9STRA|nr:hypothetical protein TrVE_jg1367 [Triparma verrucosa]